MSPAEIKLAQPSPVHERIIALDALRALAALVVLVQHFRQIFELNWPLWLKGGVFEDKAAVTLFFVLSGYVLALSLSSKAPSLTVCVKFYIRRLLRLYPVYWGALLLSFIVLWNVQQRDAGQVEGISAWYLDGNGLQLKQWLLHATLVAPGVNFHFALPPVWTLIIEARISLFFPLLAWVILRGKGWLVAIVIAGLTLGSPWLFQHVASTAAFLGMFALGAVLCRLPHALWSRLNQAAWGGLLLLGLGLYAAYTLSYAMPEVMPSLWLANYSSALGSLLLIAGTIHWPPMRSALTRLQNLLRVDLSYSIYILHYPVMVVFKKLSGPYIPASPWLAFVLVLGVTAALSLLMHFVIEKPAIELGRRLTRSRPKPAH